MQENLQSTVGCRDGPGMHVVPLSGCFEPADHTDRLCQAPAVPCCMYAEAVSLSIRASTSGPLVS